MNLQSNQPSASKFVTLETGVRVEYLEHGGDEGTPVVFLHGVTDSCRSFEPLFQHLSPQLRAVAFSQRGHGESSRPKSGYCYRDFSEDLSEFLDALRIRDAVIVGHSMGAMVAQRLAIDHPERVAGLVLIAAFSTLHRDPGIADFVAAAIDPLEDPIPAAFAREWQLSTIARPIDPQFLETVVRETQKVPARVWRAAFHAFLATPDFTHELSAVTAPTLLMWGDRDTYATRSHQDALLAVIPRARLTVYEGAGHALHWEDPAAAAAEIATFITERTVYASISKSAAATE